MRQRSIKTMRTRPSIEIDGLDHFNVRTPDLERSCRFYSEVIGLRVGDRPPFDFPGAWLYCGDRPIVHLVGDRAMRQFEVEGRAGFDHIAFFARGMAAMKRRLDAKGIAYRVIQVPGRPRQQIFLRDPDGVAIELQYDTSAESSIGSARGRSTTPRKAVAAAPARRPRAGAVKANRRRIS
jgi:catechol 2,3-dioxygenase-like lactoylglutathione lyase family enzyme